MDVVDLRPGLHARVDALDGLRAAAVVGVLLFHTGRLTGGFLGVDLFFVLSGYLITGLLLRELGATGRVSLGAFWGRRARRLAPALAVVLVAGAVAVALAGTPDLLRSTRSDGPWVQASLVNWHLLAESAGYWDRFGAPRIYEHLWSIAVEEQFYLVWPLLLPVVAGGGGRWRAEARVAAACAAGALAALVQTVLLADPGDPSRVYTGTDTRASALLLGGAAATAPVRDVLARLTGRWPGVALAWLAVAVGGSWVLVDGLGTPGLFRGGLFAHSLACAALVGLCAQAPRTALARALARRPVRWLGLVSYGVYLWHWPLAVLLAPDRTGLGPWAWTGAVCAGSVGAAGVSKRLVEDPVRFRAGWARGARGAAAFGALTAGLAVLWLALPTPAPVSVDVDELR